MDDVELPFLDLASPQFSTRSEAVKRARDQHWCARTPFGLAVLRHKHVGSLLRDKRLRQGSYAWPETNGLKGSFADFWKRSIISKEGETHRRLRSLAMPALSEDYIESLIPDFEKIAHDLTKNLTQSASCEFMRDFSIPFAGRAICALLNIDESNWEAVSRSASELGLAMGVECNAHESVFNAACDHLTDLAKELIMIAREGKDRTGFVARLLHQQSQLGDATDQELIDLIVISIFGGVDTTRSQLGFAMALFIKNPDQWQILRRKPEFIPQAIEEIIRAWPTTTWATREALEDFEFDNQPIRKGETLHMLVHASALDPEICDDPGFNVTKRRKIHFGFGGGAHHCLGALVARTDMACALRALAINFKCFEYDGDPEWLPDSGNTSPIKLPIKFELST